MSATVRATAPHIVHVRFEGFFASVEQALRPRLRGKPVLVGGNTVISASYEAKLLGAAAGMSVAQAMVVCPAAVMVPARHKRYAEFAERLRASLEVFTPAVDADSSHGFYLNFFGSPHLQGDFAGMLLRLQLEILKLAGIRVSIGAAKSKIAAAVASGQERTARRVRIIAPGTEATWVASLPLEALDGLNPVDAREFRSRGISTIAELRRIPLPCLELAFGDSLGRQIWHHARGIDARPKAIRATVFPLRPQPALSWLVRLFSDIACSSLIRAKALRTPVGSEW